MILAVLTALVPASAWTQPAPDAADDDHGDGPRAPVTFAAAIGAVAARPEVAALRQVAVATPGPIAAPGIWQVQVLPSARVDAAGDHGPEVQVSVVRQFPADALAGAQGQAARAERSAALVRVEVEALAARLEAARLWLALWATQATEALLAEEAALAKEARQLAERAQAGGAADAHAVAERRAWEAEVAARRVELDHHAHDAALRLARAAGLPFVPLPQADGPLPTPPVGPEVEDPATFAAAIARLPALRLAALDRDVARARAAEARAERGLWWQLGGMVELIGPGTVIARASLGWQGASTAHRQRDAQAAALEQAERAAELARVRRDAEAALHAAAHEWSHSRRALAVQLRRVVPASEARLALRQRAVEAGTGRLAEVIEARRGLLQARTAAVALQADAAWAAVQVWLLWQRAAPGRQP